MEKNKGITLIGLIVTIIIMLILVTVGANAIIESDIIGQAETTGKLFRNEAEKEANLTMDTLTQYSQEYCNHEWGDWIVEKAATYTATGSRYRVCKKCGLRQTEEIEKLICDPHVYNWTIIKEATCIATGLRKAECVNCHATIEDEIAPIGHNYSTATCIQKATCSQCGATTGDYGDHNYIDGKCTVCGRCQITYNLTNVSKTSGAETIAKDGTETIVIAANDYYKLPDEITVTGATLDSYNTTTGTIVIKDPTEQVTITVTGIEDSYVGRYVDINNDGTVDGIIFVDRAFVTKGGLNSGVYGGYEFSKLDDLKQYKESTYTVKDPNGYFPNGKQITLDNNSGGSNNRFIVMKLSDESGQYKWADASAKTDGQYKLPDLNTMCAFVDFCVDIKEFWNYTAGIGTFQNKKAGLADEYWTSSKNGSLFRYEVNTKTLAGSMALKSSKKYVRLYATY